jgi:hypothetical protein
MSIEQKITDLIASLDKNTAALIALAGAPKAPKGSVGISTTPAVDQLKKAEKPAKVVVEPTPEPEVTGPTKEQVAKAIEQCLKAGKKPELIVLLKSFNAANATALFAQGPEVSQNFIEAASDLLIAE